MPAEEDDEPDSPDVSDCGSASEDASLAPPAGSGKSFGSSSMRMNPTGEYCLPEHVDISEVSLVQQTGVIYRVHHEDLSCLQ